MSTIYINILFANKSNYLPVNNLRSAVIESVSFFICFDVCDGF